MDYSLKILNSPEAEKFEPQLCEILRDAVESGASVGFLPPLSIEEAKKYWRAVFAGIEAKSLILLAVAEGEEILGTVQLALAEKPNARHRAEVQKLMVPVKHRQKGVAKSLMDKIERIAAENRRTLLVLDTKKGDAAERLYQKWGWTRAGEIPGYAASSDGKPHATVFFYKSL